MKHNPIILSPRARAMFTAFLAAASLGLPLVGRADIPISTFSYNTLFDGTFDNPNSTLTPPFVGIGSLSYDAPSPLPDGIYDWDSFTRLQIVLDVADYHFTQADLTTSSSQVNIHLVGNSFFFSNDFVFGDGGHGGSADFFEPQLGYLTTEPYDDAGSGPCCGGGATTPLYAFSGELGSGAGTYGIQSAVPESSTYAAGGMLVLALAGAWWRARRCQA